MGKRGPMPRREINTQWSPELAYVVGLLASDGCLVEKGHLIDLTSKDKEQIENFLLCLNKNVKIGTKGSGSGNGRYYRAQFKSVLFYNFLVSIGLTPAKSKTIGELKIPNNFFFDFLRGSFDGDGCTYSYWDKRWKSSYMYYLSFASASKRHLEWIRERNKQNLGVRGHITHTKNKSLYQLRYAKSEGNKILKKMYANERAVCLSRKKLKIDTMLRTIGERL